MSSDDTIFALATGPGKSAIAIVRISGPQALTALSSLTCLPPPPPRYAQLATLYIPTTSIVIDQALILYFNAPHSFTGEEVVELHLHGSIAVIRELLPILASLPGLRQAHAGEFSRRAFLNGKMDLTEAEGVADLIDAETREQKTQALRQLQGVFSLRYQSLRTQVIQCLALLEAYIDFPDEDIPESTLLALHRDIDGLKNTIAALLADGAHGERLRDGVQIVILGAPNAGKSSLLNRLAQRDVAIVSHHAGTTRDVLEVHLDIAGYPVILKDTAGIRETLDEVEREGVGRALLQAEKADIKIMLLDVCESPFANEQTLALFDEHSLIVFNKCDLKSAAQHIYSENHLPVSAKTGEGIDELLNAIKEKLHLAFSRVSSSFITRDRHRQLLEQAYQSLERSQCNLPLELKCEELRLAAAYIGEITGQVYVDNVLEVIFKQFCIGK